MKRIIFTTIISLFIATGSFAQTYSGSCGANLTWTLNNGVLTISGTGAMTNYSYERIPDIGDVTTAPWGIHTASLQSLVLNEGITHIGDCAFAVCTGLTGSLTIPNSVISIGDNAFNNCFGFTGNLTIPNSVKTIEAQAFIGCSGFNGGLTIGNSVETIGHGAFYSCTGFSGNLTIPNSVKTIVEYAFAKCSGFTGNLTIGNSVKTIEEATFWECTGFKGNLTIGSAVETIGYGSFRSTSFTGNLTIPNSVKIIERYAFTDCTGFKGNLTIGNSVKTIEEAAFYGCTGFTGNLTIPNSVVTIGNNAFTACTGFTGNLTIGSSVKTIGVSAFWDCTGFKGSLTIGAAVETIDEYAFYDCAGFTSIISRAIEPPAAVSNTFGNMNYSIPVHVAPNKVSAYRSATGWSRFNYSSFQGSLNTVTFRSNGGSAVPAQAVESGGTIDPVISTRPNMTLEGWYTSEMLTNKWIFATDVVNEDMTLYAKWTEGSSSIESATQLSAGVYSNADGTFTVDVANSETFNVTVVNISGQIVKCETAKGGSHIVNICNQPAGVYMFVIDNGKQKTTVKVSKR